MRHFEHLCTPPTCCRELPDHMGVSLLDNQCLYSSSLLYEDGKEDCKKNVRKLLPACTKASLSDYLSASSPCRQPCLGL